MPKVTQWTDEIDAALYEMVGKRRLGLRHAERRLGISRSVLSQRAHLIGARRAGNNDARSIREEHALPPGHPLTWGAIVQHLSDGVVAYPLPVFA